MNNHKTDALLSGLTVLAVPHIETLAISYLHEQGIPLSPQMLEQAKQQIIIQLSTAIRRTQSHRHISANFTD
jgi:hypothetical protein